MCTARGSRGASPEGALHFGVDDTDTAVAGAVEPGGGVRMPAASVAGVGRPARMEGPYGARFAVLRGDPRGT
ncbi:hypothetical protein [Streptomyces sp. NRRL F-2305]|uniref:hypothetical protein n=1 Tax=Streptomyces TaxID=1883 RepID=UPI000A98FFF0